ncbi:redoxin domain-containing protein [Tenacibaculum tangerinum]|uniref:Thioredoxin peroxidase n=1 Tax=Tenacibaculum tangerinum TaxID=3038772 RepID=A0ABY8L0Z6_9FLAO|nr:redoxin domain-containing protein [Tenacibaculum tangerinum]WGH75129.1 redoxin domain-containing protein [Tenacibaculum tangerinum]
MKKNKLLEAGTEIPDFTLRIGNGNGDDHKDNFMTLSDHRGQNVILAFYPADWSAVCGNQMMLYNELIPMFENYNAVIYGISVDGTHCHAAFKEHNNMTIPLLCDFEPKGEISKLLGVYNHEKGFCERALFVIDKNGIIQWSHVSPMDVNPGAKEILETLKNIEK